MTRLRTSPHLSRAGIRKAFSDWHFRSQVPIGPYFADFACHGARLILEIDGSHHHEAAEYDAERTRFLESRGYKVLRFWNNQVLRELDGVLTAIAAALPFLLVGEGGAQRRMGGARRSRAPASRSAPPPPALPARGREPEAKLEI